VTVCLFLFIFIAINYLALLSPIAIAGGLCFLVSGFFMRARKRLLLATPRRRIGGAALGPVEVNGRATGPHTMPAPITGQDCFLYHTTAWQQREGQNQDWEKVAEETLHMPFFIDDSTGQLLTEPLGADLDLLRDFREEYPEASFSSNLDDVPPRVKAFLARHGVVPAWRVRVEEHSIKPEDILFVAGTLMENPGIRVRPHSPRNNVRPSVPTEAPAEARNGELGHNSPRRPAVDNFSEPVAAPQVIRLAASASAGGGRPVGQQATIAAALARAGIAMPDMWSTPGIQQQTPTIERNPPIATVSTSTGLHLQEIRLVEAPTQESAPASSSSGFDLTPPVVLMRGPDHRTFAISYRSGKELVVALTQKSATLIWGGSVITALGMYVLLRGR
jgi:hypothetical protein